MTSNPLASLRLITTALAMSPALTTSALAHDGHSQPHPGKGTEVTPTALAQLESVRKATARYLDVDAAVADGYVDVGAFVPHMGWHYVNSGLIDRRFEPKQPEILVYADDLCSGKRRLVAVEYAIPLPLLEHAPAGFVGRTDGWEADHELGLWTLHAWVWEYNPDGVFAPFNPRVP